MHDINKNNKHRTCYTCSIHINVYTASIEAILSLFCTVNRKNENKQMIILEE